MGQRANSGRNAKLDEKKLRAAGRQQNEPSRKAITGRQERPEVPGAFGRKGHANRRASATRASASRSATGSPYSAMDSRSAYQPGWTE